ncbi:MAG: hypothetical protein JNK15_21155 [Planctomycetes bacterium]|nr:hypothetical protein [Planctomycetota bacterium]
MDTIDRRSFLGASLGFAAAGAAPEWLRAAYAIQDPAGVAGPARGPLVREQAKRALEQGKPLLVFVVPEEERQRFEWGSWLGSWLVSTPAGKMPMAAQGVPVCAPLKDVRAVLGDVAVVGTPMLLVVDVAAGDGGVLSCARATPVAAPPAPRRDDRTDFLEALDAASAAGFQIHAGGLDVLAQRVRDRLPAETFAALTKWSDGGPVPSDPILFRAAALVQCMAPSWPAAVRAERLQAAAEACRRELGNAPVPGSLWGRAFGCGSEIVGADGKTNESMFACGRGNVPPAARRFLFFYTRSS